MLAYSIVKTPALYGVPGIPIDNQLSLNHLLVPTGLEPAHTFVQRILNPPRLPIPPRNQIFLIYKPVSMTVSTIFGVITVTNSCNRAFIYASTAINTQISIDYVSLPFFDSISWTGILTCSATGTSF